MSPTVTTMVVVADAPANPRMSPRSMSAPNSGAMTNTTNRSERNGGHPHASLSCQKVKAMNIPMAPCAKLKIPDVV